MFIWVHTILNYFKNFMKKYGLKLVIAIILITMGCIIGREFGEQIYKATEIERQVPFDYRLSK